MRKYYEKFPELSVYLLFLTITIIGYWQIAFLKYSLQWDMLDCFLPWRYFAGDCIQNGQLPLWNPYQHLGYPIHADLRSSWYPEVYLIGLTAGYSNITIHLLYIFYISLAGFGMYKLSQHFYSDRKISIITGSAYLLSGFFICHGQDLGFIISASLIPFVFFYYLSFLNSPGIYSLLKISLFILLLIFGAYPPFTIFTVYFLIAVFLTKIISGKFYRDKVSLKKLIVFNSYLLLIILAGSSVLIIAYFQINPWVERISGLTYERASLNPFSPQSMLSWLLPFAMVKNTALFDTDISMNNAYWGLIIMIFFVIFLLKKKNTFDRLFLITGVFALFASFGDYLPVHSFLYNFVPGMNLFRMPGFFILFTILTFILLSGNGIRQLFISRRETTKKLFIPSVSAIILFVTAIIFSLTQTDSQISFKFNDFSSFRDFIRSFDQYHHIIIQSIIQIIVLILFIILLKPKTSNGNISFYLTSLIVVEMFLTVQLNMHFTGVNEHNPLAVRKILQNKPDGFPVPDDVPVSTFTENASKSIPLWRNVNIFSKKPGFEGFNSFTLDNYDYLIDSFPQFKDEILKNKIVYFSDRIYPISDLLSHKAILTDSTDIYAEDAIYNKLKDVNLTVSDNDRLIINKFTPNEVKIKYQSEGVCIITILQADYTGWEAFIDNKPVEHFTSNILFKSVIAPSGNHELIFRYINKPVIAGFYLSYLIFISLLTSLLFLYYKNLKMNKRSKPSFYILLSIILFSVIYIVIRHTVPGLSGNSFSKIQGELKNLDAEYSGKKALTILNTNGSQDFFGNSELKNSEIKNVSLRTKYDIKNLTSVNIYDYIILVNHNIEKFQETEEVIKTRFPYHKILGKWRNSDLTVYSKETQTQNNYIFQAEDDFESNGNNHCDSIKALKFDWSNPEGRCFSFDTMKVWGPGFNIKTDKNLQNKLLQVNMNCDIVTSENCENKMVIEIYRNNIRKSWFGGDMQNFVTDNGIWGKAAFCQPIGYKLEEGDEIKAYIWNVNRKPFSIDNLKINITEAK